MDTDDLSIPTYNGIIVEAERFNHDLTLQFGALAANCKDDDEYLNQAEALIKRGLNKDNMFDPLWASLSRQNSSKRTENLNFNL
ncbi:MAG: hypothetical protein U1C58_03020 [Flavobacteriaceae bacterium]|nr:hypothetical protein [Flavobacteriaceae bacterium]